jgi:hypothetical protein
LQNDNKKGGKGKSRRGGGDSSSGGVGGNQFSLVQKESSKVAIELNNGMMVEFLKELMFTHAVPGCC